MRIICPTCASHYEVEPDKIGASGQLVRCAECREVWLVRSDDRIGERPAIPVIAAPAAPDRAVRPFTGGTIDFESAKTRLRRRGAGAEGTRQRNGATSLLSVGIGLAATFGLMLAFRTTIVTHVAAAAPAYAALGLPVNTDGLAIRGVRSVMIADGDKPVLTLEGEITNLRDAPTAVPNLTVVVRDDAKTPLYTWTTAAPKARLGKGETIAFRSRLAAPPAEGHDVHVSFADPSGTIAAHTDRRRRHGAIRLGRRPKPASVGKVERPWCCFEKAKSTVAFAAQGCLGCVERRPPRGSRCAGSRGSDDAGPPDPRAIR